MSGSLAAALIALAAGALAYVFLLPLLTGERRAAKRQRALVGVTGPVRREERAAGVNRRDQVAQTLKDIEEKGNKKARVRLEVRILRAGLTWSERQFYLVSAGLGFGLGFGLFALTGAPLFGLAGLFVGGLGLPRWMLAYLQKRRVTRFALELPNAIDVIVRGIRAGLPLGDCLRIIAREASEPVRSEFRAVVEAQALGIPVGEACLKLYERMPVSEANFFAIVVGIQQKSGGNLSEALSNLSKVLRERRKLKSKIQAMSTEAKASAAIIACLPFMVATLTYITSPTYIELLWSTQAGIVVLVVSGLWMSMGVFVMRGMINFEV